MKIESIQVRNFRSIQSSPILKFRDLNIFVGKNDAGKSNLLRALDLFFNDGDGYKLNWERDFCSFAQTPKRKAPEIQITLNVQPSVGFSPKNIKWMKIWRKDGSLREEINFADNSELPARSKIPAMLRYARLDYVPAIKGDDYFCELLASIHDMLARTVENNIRQAAKDFTKAINTHTRQIITEIGRTLSLESSIALPTNLRDLFARLEFSSNGNGRSFSLKQRGDGIKARHIPIILKWLASQLDTLSAPGRPKATTFWAYEEPENNLELSSCLSLAQEMVDSSDTIQTFVTTHSPAFYSVANEAPPEKVSVFSVNKNAQNGSTSFELIQKNQLPTMDESMGLMFLIHPYISEARKEKERLEKIIRRQSNRDKPTVFVEGPSDKDALMQAIDLFFPEKNNEINVECSPRNGGGHTWVADMVIAWAHQRMQVKAVGLFDSDSDAKQSKNKANDVISKKSGSNAKCLILESNEYLRDIFRAGFNVPYSIDELFSGKYWNYAEEHGWLVSRSEHIPNLYNYSLLDRSFNDYLNDRLPESEKRKIVIYKINRDNKKDFIEYLCGLSPDEKKQAFSGIKPTLEKIFSALS